MLPHDHTANLLQKWHQITSAGRALMIATVEKGDKFRDVVISLLEAADIRCIGELRRQFKKVDIEATMEDRFDGRLTLIIEAKDYAGNLPKQECINFVAEYGTHVRNNRNCKAWLVSKGGITPDGRELVEQQNGCRCFTFAELQRWILNLGSYTDEILAQFDREKIGHYFVEPGISGGGNLNESVDAWLVEPNGPPLAITGGYGIGKTTFAKHLAARLGALSQADITARVPILIPLGEVYNEQSIDGLIGKVLASTYRVPGYHFRLFEKLNASGRFVLIFDGFDEMKHGMTIRGFERNVSEFMTLDKGDARIIVLGRDTAFHTEVEFRSIIEGKRRTFGGSQVADISRRAFRTIMLRGFSIEEAKRYITKYFPIAVEEAKKRQGNDYSNDWIEARMRELVNGSLDELLDRPVHAQMLCEIATDLSLSIKYITRYQLYDLFVHHLINREVAKKGRFANFDIDTRRKFNSALAWWLWERGGASTTTFVDIPHELCANAVSQSQYDFDEIALRRELVAGCLISKGSDTIFFSHRSIQEFLVAEHLISTDLISKIKVQNKPTADGLPLVLQNMTEEIAEFTVGGVINQGISMQVVAS